jgi:hypothetical protein
MMLKNKILIGLVLLVMLLFTSLAFLFKLYQNEKEERTRFSNNMVALIKNKSMQQELTFRELKDLYPKYDSIAKVLNIKTKYITNIVDTKYRFKDSTLSVTVLKKDSVSEKSYFNLTEKCYSLSGYIKKDSISFTKKEVNDKLTTFLYKDWHKKYLWGLLKFKPYYNAKVYSECMKDTISVINNIKIKE